MTAIANTESVKTMNKRSTKFYRKNEEEVMAALGLKPTKNSGSGWIEKEDGQNDYIICQLKSTDAQSIRVNQKDIRILERNASIAHKLPVFAIQFLNTGEVWLMAKPEDFTSVSEYIENGETTTLTLGIDLSQCEDVTVNSKRIVNSALSAREQFYEQRQRQFIKQRSAK